MSYEFRVTELAGEFNVHRNTIRNWINSGILPAQKTAGRRYRVKRPTIPGYAKNLAASHLNTRPLSRTWRHSGP